MSRHPDGSGGGPGRCLVSWSGGKDSTLVLHRLQRRGVEVVGLLTMFSPETGTSRSHGLPRELLEEQAEGWGLPLHVGYASWQDYEEQFKGLVGRLVRQEGVEAVAFGDIYLEDHRLWVERVCREVGCRALEPLWGEPTRELAREVLGLGIEARVCTLRSDCLEHRWLGRPLDGEFLAHLQERGLDPCGEHGEYHTVVVADPAMGRYLVVEEATVEESRDHGHWVIRAWRWEPVR